MELFPEECRDAGRLEFSVEARAAEAEGDGLGGAVLPEPVQGQRIYCLPDSQGDVSDMDSKFMGMLSRHIWERHGVRTAWHLDENIEGVRIYRLRKTWFQPGKQELPPSR